MTNKEATERIATAFEAGIAPWSRSSRLRITCGLPLNAATGKPFQGVNTWLLELDSIERKFRNRFWATPKQWEHLGGVIVRGEGTSIIDDGDVGRNGDDCVFFNLEQVDVRRPAPLASLDRFLVAPQTFPDYDLAQRLLDATGATVVMHERCYCLTCSDPSRDFIAMQPLDPLWGDTDRWWSVLFHELTHWAAEGFDRVRWRGEYNHCELVAEIGATTLTNHCGIPMPGYFRADRDMYQNWINNIRENIGYLTFAFAVAEVAVGYVLNNGRWEVPA
jgi:antirestriction protein ArdC